MNIFICKIEKLKNKLPLSPTNNSNKSDNEPNPKLTNLLTEKSGLLNTIQEQKETIQQLAKALRRDYSIVWRDIRALEELGLVKLHK